MGSNVFPVLGKGVFFVILASIIVLSVSGQAIAQAPPPRVGSGHINEGIPVYWPFHVLLITTGFVLLVAGLIAARYHKTRNWYKTHVILQLAGVAGIIGGVVVGIYMVARSGMPHLINIHEILGVTIGVLVIVAIIIGYCIKRAQASKNSVRLSHRWLGRIAIALVIFNIILGVFFLSKLLNR